MRAQNEVQNFNLREAFQILERTPRVFSELLLSVSESWAVSSEGGESWNAYDIVGHLVVGEKTDWIIRTRTILEHGKTRPFEPFDRFSQFEESAGKSLDDLLNEFSNLRTKNLITLRSMVTDESDLGIKGIHPNFGDVTLRQLLAAWVVHDLGHIAQICRVMSKRYSLDVGPWRDYLPILSDRV